MTEEVKLLDLNILSEEDIEEYDLERNEFIVDKWFKNYRRLSRCSTYGPKLLSSSDYKMVWVDESRKSINSYTELDKYIDDSNEYIKLGQIIKIISESISNEERIFMTCNYIYKKSIRTALDEIRCGKSTIYKIKKSFIINFACKIGEAIEKGMKLTEDEEIEFEQWLIGRDESK